MKQIYLLTTFIFFNFIIINAQTVTIANSCDPTDTDGDYALSADINNRPSYVKDPLTIQWSGTRWELVVTANTSLVGMYNDLDTPTPPATSLSPWTAGLCDPAGVFTGDGTTTGAVGFTDVGPINKKLSVFPNPSSEYITVSGLENNEQYTIYNYMGAEIIQGTISDNEIIDIQNLSNGSYFLNFNNANTLKFIKE